MSSYTKETFTSADGNTEVHEFKFSDGTRYVKSIKTGTSATGKVSKTTTVVRADFEGDNEHKSTMKELHAALNLAEQIVMQLEPATDAAVVAAIVAENEARQDAPIVEETTVEEAPAAEEAPELTLADFIKGDIVKTRDGREWTVVGPAQGDTTLKLVNAEGKSTFRFPHNITKA